MKKQICYLLSAISLLIFSYQSTAQTLPTYQQVITKTAIQIASNPILIKQLFNNTNGAILNLNAIKEFTFTYLSKISQNNFPANMKQYSGYGNQLLTQNAQLSVAYENALKDLPANIRDRQNPWWLTLQNTYASPSEYFSSPYGYQIYSSICEYDLCNNQVAFVYNASTNQLSGFLFVAANNSFPASYYTFGVHNDYEAALVLALLARQEAVQYIAQNPALLQNQTNNPAPLSSSSISPAPAVTTSPGQARPSSLAHPAAGTILKR